MKFDNNDFTQFNTNRPPVNKKFENVKVTLRAIIKYCSLPENKDKLELQVVSEMAKSELERQLS